MSTNSPLKTIQDGLVFYFDANNPKSYKGKPTTNLLSNPTNEVIGTTSEFVQYADLAPIFDTYGTSVAYSLSLDLKAKKAGSVLAYMQNGSWSKYNFVYQSVNVDTVYNRFYFNNITPSIQTPSETQAILAFYSGYGSGIIPSIKNVQVEISSVATPFVVGVRSNTQGLLDLTKRTTIDLTNTKFDSNALLDFPINASANSYATTNTNCNLTGDQTLTAWIKPTFGSSTPHRTVICTDKDYQYGIKLMNYKNYARWGLWLGWGSSNYEALTITDINDNKWKMITGTWKQSTGIVTLYLNGEYVTQFSTGNTSALSLSTGNIWVGMGYELDFGNGQSYEGKIDSAAIYNKTLNLDEIRQLYLRTKSRYGL